MKLPEILVYFGLMLLIVDSSLIDYIEEGCYGSNGDIDILKPRCPATNQVIYPRDVYTYAKRIATGCPRVAHLNDRNETYCCRYVNETEDCGMRYGDDTTLVHYTPFTGQDTGQIQVSNNKTINVCDQSIYFPATNYMRMTYNCINSSQIGSVCNSSLTGNPLYMWNDGYPNSDDGCSSTSGCKCTIQASGGSTIQIDALDIRFVENTTSGNCAQRLFITDGLSSSDIACDDVNLFERRSLFTSSSDLLQLRYDNTNDNDTGNFWISLEATDSGETLTITCSQSDANIEYSCGDNFTIISPFTTISTTEISPTSTSTDISQTSTTTDTLQTSTITDISPTRTTTDIVVSATDYTTASTSADIQSSMSFTDSTTSSTTSLKKAFSYTTTTYDSTAPSSDILPTASSSGYQVTPSNTVSGTNTQNSSQSSSASKGPIIGIIVGVVFALALTMLVGYGVYRKKCRGNYKVEDSHREYEDLFENRNNDVITSRPPELPRIGTGFGRFESLP